MYSFLIHHGGAITSCLLSEHQVSSLGAPLSKTLCAPQLINQQINGKSE